MLVRKADAEAASAAALTDFRAGKIDQATASLLKASADADVQDLQALIDGSATVLTAINDELAQAQAKAAQAETAARNEELALVAKELDEQIQALEKVFLDAIRERGRIYAKQNPKSSGSIGSAFNFYRASPELDALVRQNAIPKAA
ncbi:hypothetical protein [Caballeronia mineralivorans]|uniref:hypothetical protein n=1 Tax=Caballeronia mineralivorans TaxID=2010198 RepID=UPI00128E3675|nr:hypothetical protein [Caballeronia mineralivorans]